MDDPSRLGSSLGGSVSDRLVGITLRHRLEADLQVHDDTAGRSDLEEGDDDADYSLNFQLCQFPPIESWLNGFSPHPPEDREEKTETIALTEGLLVCAQVLSIHSFGLKLKVLYAVGSHQPISVPTTTTSPPPTPASCSQSPSRKERSQLRPFSGFQLLDPYATRVPTTATGHRSSGLCHRTELHDSLSSQSRQEDFIHKHRVADLVFGVSDRLI